MIMELFLCENDHYKMVVLYTPNHFRFGRFRSTLFSIILFCFAEYQGKTIALVLWYDADVRKVPHKRLLFSDSMPDSRKHVLCFSISACKHTPFTLSHHGL